MIAQTRVRGCFAQAQSLGVEKIVFLSTLVRKLKTSEEEHRREILCGKSIARGTSCFVENAKTHNAFPQNSFPARADFRKESFARAYYQGFSSRPQQKAFAWGNGFVQVCAVANALAG